MPIPSAPLTLLPPAARSTRTAFCPRLARGGFGCRVLTTYDMMAEIGEASAPITAEQALATLSAAIDRAATFGVAA